jgi:transcriptional regulator with XRE-family HTH domain
MVKLRVKEIAEAQGFSQSRLQRESGVTMPTLRRYWFNQTDSVHLESIERIAKALGVQVSDLFENGELPDNIKK